MALALFLRPASDAAGVASAYLIPSRIALVVEPGNARVRAGQSFTVRARLRGAGGMSPSLVAGGGPDAVPVPMTRQDDGSYAATVDDVTASFVYHVVAGARALRRVLGHRGAPAGGRAHRPRVPLSRHAEAADALRGRRRRHLRALGHRGPLHDHDRSSRGVSALALADGSKVALQADGRTSTGTLTVAADGAYRVTLADDDGTDAQDDTEYFIRMLLDRPPDVRVVRPAGDRQVTPLEEVLIEARADDDFGVTALDLVLQKPGDPEVVVPLPGPRDGLTASGSYLLYLENLEVAPGDFVSYFVRARDVGRGKPPVGNAQRHVLPGGQGVRRRVRRRPEPGDGCRRPGARGCRTSPPPRRKSSSPPGSSMPAAAAPARSRPTT